MTTTQLASGSVAPSTTQIGDLVTVTIREGRRIRGEVTEVPVQNMFRVASVDQIGDNMWCRGPVVVTTSESPRHYVGRDAFAYLGKVGA